jgi:Serine aminopeptidase, S33
MARFHCFLLHACFALLSTGAPSATAWAQTSHPPSTFPAEAQALTPDALTARLSGQKFTSRYANGMTASMHFGADQSMQLEMSTGLQAKGTWRVEGAQICMQFGAGLPSGCGEVRATATQLLMRRYTNQEVVQLETLAAAAATGAAAAPASTPAKLRPVFHAVPTDRAGVTMNIALLEPSQAARKVLLVVAGTDGSEGRIMIQGAMAPFRGALQYLAPHADLFDQAGIALVAMGCPTDQWVRYGQCDDDYRSSQQYVDDVTKVMDFLRTQYGWPEFYVFGHSSGGISSRWLSLKMPTQLKGAVNSSVMNGTAGSLARSMVRFDMSAITIPVLNIAHEDDQCPSTPYHTVKRYAKDNLVTVRGGGQSGHICGGANRHSFEGRQRGVSRAIVQWMTTGQVQTVVDTDQ